METCPFASYNHTALLVIDLDSSVACYQYIFNFDTINYPFPYRKHIKAKWLSIGGNAELHLGEFIGDTTQHYYTRHIGFTDKSIDSIFSRPKNLIIRYLKLKKHQMVKELIVLPILIAITYISLKDNR
ncbi:hypothetical protein [uncultured Algibacter sp.]|uniref:hypothetical protein n=1 Tax=uncultured Algibacter sp. TaxID=298659 RepID=UPI0026181C9A|nr:hypothetical protein [uncultured Algibacter sp.]